MTRHGRHLRVRAGAGCSCAGTSSILSSGTLSLRSCVIRTTPNPVSPRWKYHESGDGEATRTRAFVSARLSAVVMAPADGTRLAAAAASLRDCCVPTRSTRVNGFVAGRHPSTTSPRALQPAHPCSSPRIPCEHVCFVPHLRSQLELVYGAVHQVPRARQVGGNQSDGGSLPPVPAAVPFRRLLLQRLVRRDDQVRVPACRPPHTQYRRRPLTSPVRTRSGGSSHRKASATKKVLSSRPPEPRRMESAATPLRLVIIT
jgi:hypothetical protein